MITDEQIEFETQYGDDSAWEAECDPDYRWQFEDEVEYQEKLATSVPVTVEVLNARQWLQSQHIW